MILLIVSFLFVNLILLLLVGIGGASMASVDGIALPWQNSITLFWLTANLPYLVYAFVYLKDLRNENDSLALKRCISTSAWLAFPGGVALLLFFGSKIPWAAAVFPVVQFMLAIFIYIRKRREYLNVF